jgi:hypothetical protein
MVATPWRSSSSTGKCAQWVPAPGMLTGPLLAFDFDGATSLTLGLDPTTVGSLAGASQHRPRQVEGVVPAHAGAAHRVARWS